MNKGRGLVDTDGAAGSAEVESRSRPATRIPFRLPATRRRRTGDLLDDRLDAPGATPQFARHITCSPPARSYLNMDLGDRSGAVPHVAFSALCRAWRRISWRPRERALLALCLFCLADCKGSGPPALVQVNGALAKVVATHDGDVDVQLVLEPHAEIVSVIVDFVSQNGWKSAHFVGLGACTDATVGVLRFPQEGLCFHRRMAFDQQVEIVSLIGDAAPGNKNAAFHAHVGLGFADGTLHGGHLFEAHASPTLEVCSCKVRPVPMGRPSRRCAQRGSARALTDRDVSLSKADRDAHTRQRGGDQSFGEALSPSHAVR